MGFPETTSTPEEAIPEHQLHIVDFDGPNDPEKAVNWPPVRKWLNVFVLAAMTFVA
jgi:hypothetical protein